MLPKTFEYELNNRIKKQLELIFSPVIVRNNFRGIRGIFDILTEEFPEITGMGHEYYNDVIDDYIPEQRKRDQIYAFYFSAGTNISLSILELLCICYDAIIDPINERLHYEGFGYQYNKPSKNIIKLEDEIYYEQCTSKTMGILANKKYTDALSHYARAYEELAKQKFDDALVSIGRALESLIKTRLDEAKITYSPRDTLNPLLNIIFAHIDTSATGYNAENIKQTILDAGRARNKIGGHGHPQGQSPEVDDIFTRFIINQAAANLLFLAEVIF